jgi:hypothetical protein
MDGTMTRGERWRLVSVLLFGLTAGMGCMSFNLGNTYEQPSATCYVDHTGLLRQHDTTQLSPAGDGQRTIYYSRPFANKPNLKFVKNDDSVNPNEIELVEQLPDRFTIRYRGFSTEPILAWRAEGMPAASAIPITETKGVTQFNEER